MNYLRSLHGLLLDAKHLTGSLIQGQYDGQTIARDQLLKLNSLLRSANELVGLPECTGMGWDESATTIFSQRGTGYPLDIVAVLMAENVALASALNIERLNEGDKNHIPLLDLLEKRLESLADVVRDAVPETKEAA